MESHEADYDTIMEEQAKLVEKKGNKKRRSLISKDVQYFDSTELPKILNLPKNFETGENETNKKEETNN